MLAIALVLNFVGALTIFGSFVLLVVRMVENLPFEERFQRALKAMMGVAMGNLCLTLSSIIGTHIIVSTAV